MADWQLQLEQFLQREPFKFAEEALAKNYRAAAVLVLFWDQQGAPATLVTVRSSSMPNHAGEVSFPGGGLQAGENHHEAALREAHEEVGLAPSSVRILGNLDDAWSGAGYALTPVVGICDSEPTFQTSAEVERVVAFNLQRDAEHHQRTVFKFGHEVTEPVIRAHGVDVVGLSADILAEGIEALNGEYLARGRRRLEYFRRYAPKR